MKRYPDGWKGKFFFQKDAPKHMPDWIPTAQFEASTRDKPRSAADRLPARQRRARAALDGEHGLHRHEHLVLAGRQARRGRTSSSSTSIPSPDVGFPEAIQVALLIKQTLDLLELESHRQDERLRGNPHPRADRATPHVHRHARVLRDHRRRHRARASRARDDRVDEGEAARRPDRHEPERGGEDDRVGVLGAAEAGRARLDAAALGRGERVAGSRAFTMDAVLERVAKEGDLFDGVLSSKQSLSAALKSLR